MSIKISSRRGRHRWSISKGKSVSAFPSFEHTPLRLSERERRYCNGPPLQRVVTTTTTMDAVVQASFASLSLTAVAAHRLTAAASGDGAKAAAVDRERNALKRKEYTSLRNRYFGAYFFAMFGIT